MPLPRRTLAVTLMSVTLAACATPSPAPSDGPSSPAAATDSPSPSASVAPSVAASASAPIGGTPPSLAIQTVASGLNAPINVTGTPDGRLIVNERDGRMVAVDPEGGEVTTVIDLTGPVLGGGEQGLLGLALHPDWPEEPIAYVHYTDGGGGTVISEFHATATEPSPVLDAGSERVLLQVEQPYPNHNGGQLEFGPDGYLYIGLGDGGAGGDPHGHGQDAHTLLGSVLRIDVTDVDAAAYAIPPDNPFADGVDGAPEVFLYGLRNPWRFSFDRATELLWIADVGQQAYEEIDRIDPATEAGANLGWNVTEGAHCFADAGCAPDAFVVPVSEYDHSLGCSVSGGYVYRGSEITGLEGWYLFSDYCSGILFGLPSDAPAGTAPTVLLEMNTSVSAFGQDADGELYVAAIDTGTIYRIVAAG